MKSEASSLRIAILAPADDNSRYQASLLSKSLHLPLVDPAEMRGFSFLLRFNDDHLELVRGDRKDHGAVHADLCEPALTRRMRTGRSDPLARACGLKGNVEIRILDATAGLGRDGIVLAALGASITLVERSPIVAALLADGLRRAKAHVLFAQWLESRTEFVVQDAREYMTSSRSSPRHEVVLLDPMYPHRDKSALPKKEMQSLRALLGNDGDAAETLGIALAYARQRVVVKRPPWAAPLGDRSPHHHIEAKLVRYDVYTIS